MSFTRRGRRLAIGLIGLLALGLAAGCGESAGPTAGSGQPTAAPAIPTQTFRWKLITTWPKNLPALGTVPERMAERVRLMSDGYPEEMRRQMLAWRERHPRVAGWVEQLYATERGQAAG